MMKCRVCFSKKLSKILDLGKQPWCNDFLKKNQLGLENFILYYYYIVITAAQYN